MIMYLLTGFHSRDEHGDTEITYGIFATNEDAEMAEKKVKEKFSAVHSHAYNALAWTQIDPFTVGELQI